MKKQLIIIGIIAILVCVGLSGCNSNNSTPLEDNNYNIGDSLKIGDIKYTFASARWSGRIFGYQIDISAENEGIRLATATAKSTKYITENGYEYGASGYTDEKESVNPGKTETITLSTYTVDEDFLPVVKVYLTVGGKSVILNVS